MVVVVVAIETVVTLPDAVCLVILTSNVCLGWLHLKTRGLEPLYTYLLIECLLNLSQLGSTTFSCHYFT